MQQIKKLPILMSIVMVLSFLIIGGCGQQKQDALSSDQEKDFVSNYSSESSDVVTTVKDKKLEILVNLWKNHDLVDKGDEKNKQQLYADLADKIVKDNFAKRTEAEQAAITSATVNFVYVDKQDEYGKPDFTSLAKKAQVTFTKDKDGKFTQKDLKIE